MDENEPFLARWSRRKLATKPEAPVPQAAALHAAPRGAPPAAATQAPAAGVSEGPSAEYRKFFDPQVDESLRRTALKQLFGEPQFNVMDGLDTYIDDYSKPDPIPEAMLRQLNQAKDLLLFEEDKTAQEDTSDAAATAGAPLPAALADPGAPVPAPLAGGPGADAAAAPAPAPADGGRND